MHLDIALNLLGGLVLLTIGAEATLRGAVSVARRLGLSELLIGLTLVGFGTSTPELLTSVNAALQESPGIAIGNVVGSNIANILVILGVAVLVRPILVDPKAIRRDAIVVIAVSVMLIALALGLGSFGRLAGIGFIALLALYIFTVWRMEKAPPDVPQLSPASDGTVEAPKTDPLALSLGLAVFGISLLVFGADFLVKGAIALARLAHISETVIGLTIVAIGTSLPELVASTAAAFRGKSDLAIGNVLGSNIYNILGILGVTAAIHPVTVPDDMGIRDWGFLLGTAVILALMGLRGRIGRLEGLVLLAGYGLYAWLLLPGQTGGG